MKVDLDIIQSKERHSKSNIDTNLCHWESFFKEEELFVLLSS